MIHVVARVRLLESSHHALSTSEIVANQRCSLVRFSLTLSLTQLGPEAGARLDPTGALLIPFLVRGEGAEPLPRPSPTAYERLKQTSPHPSSPARGLDSALISHHACPDRLAPSVADALGVAVREAAPETRRRPSPVGRSADGRERPSAG